MVDLTQLDLEFYEEVTDLIHRQFRMGVINIDKAYSVITKYKNKVAKKLDKEQQDEFEEHTMHWYNRVYQIYMEEIEKRTRPNIY